MNAGKMAIKQQPTSLVITFNEAAIRRLDFGMEFDGLLEQETGWVGSNLVVRSKRDRFEMTETFGLSRDGERLTVSVKAEGPRGPISFKRVFDRVEKPSA